MTPYIAQPQNRVLRDAMYIVAQISDRARMTMHDSSIHIRARDDIGTTMLWIEIPATVLGEGYSPEHFPAELGIDSKKMYRMLNAYEAAATIRVHYVQGTGTDWIKISGTEGTLWTHPTDLSSIQSIPPLARIQAHHPPIVSGTRDAGHFKDWLKQIADKETTISFRYEKGSGRFPVKTVSTVSEHSGLHPIAVVLSHPKVPDDADSLRSLISFDLLQDAISPPCINSDLKFAFGNNTPLYINTKVNGCDVAIAIAPRIDTGEEP